MARIKPQGPHHPVCKHYAASGECAQLPGAHYIEMQQGAILEAEVAVASLLSRFQGVG